jgi:hypothetical protein
MSRSGGCFCGAVRYEIRGPVVRQAVCHCQGWRRASGAGALHWIAVRPEDFRMMQGVLAELRSGGFPEASCDGGRGVRAFCAACGTPISFRSDHRAERENNVTAGSPDDPAGFVPQEELFPEHRLPWIAPLPPSPAACPVHD